MKVQNCFKRYEQKYLLNEEQVTAIKNAMNEKMIGDEYGESTICNIYFDTPDFRLIRRSLEKPIYKEKIRLRSYGTPNDNSDVFLELKKKYDGVVYKRRETFTYQEAEKFVKYLNFNSQISEEIAYAFVFYKTLHPAMYLSYKREAFYDKSNRDLRITFDKDILWRDYDLDLKNGVYGNNVLPKRKTLMEIKTASALPLWLVNALTENKVYKTSFSKYGTAYMKMINRRKRGYKHD